MRERVLVTGAGGFVGRHLLSELGPRARAARCDVTDAVAVADEVADARPDAVVHLAGFASAGASFAEPVAAWRVNVLGTVAVLHAVRDAAPGCRVLAVSTADVYAPPADGPLDEDSPTAPLSPYAASKLAAEVAVERARRVDGVDAVVLRPFPHVGPGQDGRFAIGSWVEQIAALEGAGGGTLRVGDLTVRRDLTDVRDTCRAYRLVLDRDVVAPRYAIASGRAVALAEVVDRLVGLARCPVEVRRDDARLRRVDVPALVGSAARLRADTGWEPQIDLERTLADALDHARAAPAHHTNGRGA